MLAVEEVVLSFRGVRALQGVSLVAERGELVSIIGPNGSGKSTLFNVISGIYAPDSGTVMFEGRPVTAVGAYRIALSGIARTFQNKRLFGAMSVIENVMVAALMRVRQGWLGDVFGTLRSRAEIHQCRRAAEEYVEFVGLTGETHSLACDLPYGLQNRLEFARALALEPKLLLLDEPAAGLAPHERLEVEELIRRVRERNVAIVLVEHDMKMVMRLSSRIVVLDQGKVIAQGEPAEVINDPQVIAAYFGTIPPELAHD